MKRKIQLSELSVKSFITKLNKAEGIHGGGGYTNNTTMNPICNTFTLTNTLNS